MELNLNKLNLFKDAEYKETHILVFSIHCLVNAKRLCLLIYSIGLRTLSPSPLDMFH